MRWKVCSVSFARFSLQSIVHFLAVFPVIFLFLSFNNSVAQVPPITSSGLNTHIGDPINLPTGKIQHDITGGTRPSGGANLFHSFGEFGVPTNNIANFLNDSGLPTSNILGRVTGGNISSIYGTIQTTGFGNANLFLMNPAGFLFGPNATVNVGGMIAFTSGDYLRLADGARFNAIPNLAQDALLTPSPVAAFGFLGSNPGGITVRGSQFTVTEGQNISLVGGDISIQSGTPEGGAAQQAQLIAPNGRIQLASAASAGEFDATTFQAVPNVDGTSFTSFGSVSLASGSSVNVNGLNVVSIRGGQFVLSVNDALLSTGESAGQPQSISLSPTSSIISSNEGAGPGADIEIIAGYLKMDGASVTTHTTGDGPGGGITINGQTVSLKNGAQIVSTSAGPADGGSITIRATDTVAISGYDSQGILPGVTTLLVDPNTGLPMVSSGVFTATSSSGNGGTVTISAPTVALNNLATVASLTSGDGQGGSIATDQTGMVSLNSGAQIVSLAGFDPVTGEILGSGAGGNINLRATDTVRLSGENVDFFAPSNISSLAFSSGKGGEVQITDVQNVAIEAGAGVFTGAFGSGTAGGVTIKAVNELSISGASESLGLPSNIDSSSPDGITVQASSVSLDRGLIRSFDGGISLDVSTLTITGGGAIEVRGGLGPAGPVTIDASESATISGSFIPDPSDPTNVSRIASFNTVGGGGGDITVSTGRFVLTDLAQVRNEVDGGEGGMVRITADDSITVSDGSRIVNRINPGGNAGGFLELSAPSISIDGQVIISTAVVGNAPAGGIRITTENDFTLSGGSVIQSSTQQGVGQGGAITITTLDSAFISGGSRIESNSSAGGDAGTVSINAKNMFSLAGSGSGLFTEARGSGDGGTITANASQVQITNGGVISAKSTGSGAAGSVTIQGNSSAQSVLISGPGSRISTETQGTGSGGNIDIDALSVTMSNGGTISASSSGQVASPGNAGNIMVTATNGLTMQNSSILTEAAQGAGGGDIKITTGPSATVLLQNSRISASVADGPGGGGNISIDPQFVILQNSQILAQAAQGQGGSISITTGLFLPDANSVVNADSGSGLNGTVTIQSPNAPAGGRIVPLSQKPLIATGIMTQRCAALAGGEFSSFTVAGRDTLPAEPGGWLSSPLAFTISETGNTATKSVMRGPVDEPISDPPLVSLRQIAPPGFLIQAFAADESAGCRS
jgi:filamentous hemagglutinin family protein